MPWTSDDPVKSQRRGAGHRGGRCGPAVGADLRLVGAGFRPGGGSADAGFRPPGGSSAAAGFRPDGVSAAAGFRPGVSAAAG